MGAPHFDHDDVSPWWGRVFWSGVFVAGAYVVTSGFTWRKPEPEQPLPEAKPRAADAPVPPPAPAPPRPRAEPVRAVAPPVDQMSMNQLSERIAELEKTLATMKQVQVPEQPGAQQVLSGDTGRVPSAEESARALQEILAKQQLDSARGEGDRDREILKEVERRSAEVAGDLRSQLRAFENERQKRLDQIIEDAK